MPDSALPERLAEFLRQPNPAVMATVAADGRPVTVATWYLLEDDGRIMLGLDAKRARIKHMRKDPRISLTVMPPDDWYSHVSLQGRVVSIEDDVDLKDIDRLSRLYTGNEYPNRESPRVTVQVEITHSHAWGKLR